MNIHRGGGGIDYTLYANHAAFNPVDATTYFTGNPFIADPSTTASTRKILIPAPGIIKRVDLVILVQTILGSGELSTINIRLNNLTDTVITSSLDLSLTTSFYTNSALNIAVVAGDFIELKWVTPTWVTNPTSVRMTAQIYIG